MEEDDLLRLNEISPDPIGFGLAVTNRLKRMVHGMAEGYLGSMNHPFHPRHTGRLLLYIQNSDSINAGDHSFFFSPGNAHSPTGIGQVFLSETNVLSLDDEGKANLILALLHSLLLNIAGQHQLDVQSLHDAHQNFLKQKYYYNSYPAFKSPHGKYTAQIQSKENWGSAGHRLVVTDLTANQTEIYPVITTPYTFFDELSAISEENKWDVILNTTRLFDPVHWEGKDFIFYWGKDRYQFDAEKKNLTCG